jgi:signal transduction histidine kinase
MHLFPLVKLSTTVRLRLAALFLGLAMIAVAVLVLWHLRQNTVDSQARELGLLSLALSDEIDRGLQGAQEGLQAMQGELRDGRLPMTGSMAARALSTRAGLMPMIRTLWLIDTNGQLLSASDATPVPDQSKVPITLPQHGIDVLTISRPFPDPLTQESLVALSVLFETAPGKIGGQIVAAIPAARLLGAFSAATPATDARMAVYSNDGVLLAGWIVTNPSQDEAGVAQRLARPRDIELRRFRDGTERLVSLHSLPRFGLKVMLTRDLEMVLMGWREGAQLTAFAMALVLLISFIAIFMVQRAQRHRREAQLALQAQRTRTSKLESMGTLAGGVAHDFNNVLAAILGFAEMAQDAAEPGSSQARHLDKVLKAALRGKALAERVLAFSRGGAHTSVVFELEPVVQEVLSMLAANLRPGVVVAQELMAPGARLLGDPTQAFEAVMNLCTNALQAMPDGGMITIELVRLTTHELQVLSHSQLPTGNYLTVSVTDQGKGITPEVMDHLFEPFFTTRSANSGTGLGLAVVHGVVAEQGGAINVQSSPGQGSRFTLYFPECTDFLEAAIVLPEPEHSGAGQTLLVLDDDPILVTMMQELLTSLGYFPVGFSDPALALQSLRDDPNRFAAVITDEVMPGLTGTQLTQALRQFAPDLPVLLVSGYGGALLAKRAAAAGVNQVLGKPLQRTELARSLAQLLG